MSTGYDSLAASTLFSKNRRAVLALLFGHPDETFYVRQIARACGPGMGAIQRELAQLTAAGILRRTVSGHQVYYQANPECPIFAELKSLVAKTVGVADVLRAALTPLADRIAVAFVFGSVVHGGQRRASDVDLAVIGDVTFAEVVDVLAGPQENLSREINPVVYSAAEYSSKLAAGHHFVRALVEQEKVFLIGGERDLAGLATRRVACRTQKRSGGNAGSAGRHRP